MRRQRAKPSAISQSQISRVTEAETKAMEAERRAERWEVELLNVQDSKGAPHSARFPENDPTSDGGHHSLFFLLLMDRNSFDMFWEGTCY